SSRRRHTRFSRDWSSDVCSSDLFARPGHIPQQHIPSHDVIGRFGNKPSVAGTPFRILLEHFLNHLVGILPLAEDLIKGVDYCFRSEERRVGKELRSEWCRWGSRK